LSADTRVYCNACRLPIQFCGICNRGQVHVRTGTAGDSHVTIFSKSGRNSTMDQEPLLPTITACLSMDTTDCRFQRQCNLVGELLVWSDHTQEIMPFFKIQRHVTREGRRLGCDQDSPRSPDEHLMIIFYDVHVLDDINGDSAYSRSSALFTSPEPGGRPAIDNDRVPSPFSLGL
jgi:hypothetical protein